MSSKCTTWNMSSRDNHTGFVSMIFLSGKILDIVNLVNIVLVHSLFSFIVLSGIMALPRLLCQNLSYNFSYPFWSPSLLSFVALHWKRGPVLIHASFRKWPLIHQCPDPVSLFAPLNSLATEIFWSLIFPIFYL